MLYVLLERNLKKLLLLFVVLKSKQKWRSNIKLKLKFLSLLDLIVILYYDDM